MKKLFVSIEYDEAEPANSYEGITLTNVQGVELAKFYSGDPVKDWKNFVESLNEEGDITIMETSSLTHFVMDNEGYFWDKDGMLQSEIDFVAQKHVEHR